jgi:hypothetical protein
MVIIESGLAEKENSLNELENSFSIYKMIFLEYQHINLRLFNAKDKVVLLHIKELDLIQNSVLDVGGSSNGWSS